MSGPWGVSWVTQFEPLPTSMPVRFMATVALVLLVTRNVVPNGAIGLVRPGLPGRDPDVTGSSGTARKMLMGAAAGIGKSLANTSPATIIWPRTKTLVNRKASGLRFVLITGKHRHGALVPPNGENEPRGATAIGSRTQTDATGCLPLAPCSGWAGSPFLPTSSRFSMHLPGLLDRLPGESVEVKRLDFSTRGTTILSRALPGDDYLKKLSAPVAVNHHVHRELPFQRWVRCLFRTHKLCVLNQLAARLRLPESLPIYKLVQEVEDNVNFKKIPAAGCDRLIGNSKVLSRSSDNRVARWLPRIHGVNRGRTIKLVTLLDYLLQGHGFT
jgi:hypothetical protein